MIDQKRVRDEHVLIDFALAQNEEWPPHKRSRHCRLIDAESAHMEVEYAEVERARVNRRR